MVQAAASSHISHAADSRRMNMFSAFDEAGAETGTRARPTRAAWQSVTGRVQQHPGPHAADASRAMRQVYDTSASSGGPLHHSTIRPARLGKPEASRTTCTIKPSNASTIAAPTSLLGFGVQWLHGAMLGIRLRCGRRGM